MKGQHNVPESQLLFQKVGDVVMARTVANTNEKGL